MVILRFAPRAGALKAAGLPYAVIDGTGEFTGKRFLALRAGTTSGDNAGPTFVDITGPWR